MVHLTPNPAPLPCDLKDLERVTAAAFGLAAVIASSAAAFTWIKWLGVAYLAWIGLDVIEITGPEVYPVTGVSARWAYLALIAGFAGATADAFTLLERLEAKLEQYPEQLTRACVELAKDWRTDRYLRRLEAMMLVADRSVTLALTGTGDVLEPEHGVMAIGSGGNYALAAARALLDTDKGAEEIARKAMQIASEICVYTNANVVVETLDAA